MTTSLLSQGDIRELSRDLQILIATNGTLTRILSIVGDDEIVLEIVNQGVQDSPQISDCAELPESRVLHRRVLLKGRSSGSPLVAAESRIAIDSLPTALVTSLTETDHPIGEALMASRLESYKEPANVWIGEVPRWVAVATAQNNELRTVARRYRTIVGGQPLMTITEYFLRDTF